MFMQKIHLFIRYIEIKTKSGNVVQTQKPFSSLLQKEKKNTQTYMHSHIMPAQSNTHKNSVLLSLSMFKYYSNIGNLRKTNYCVLDVHIYVTN